MSGFEVAGVVLGTLPLVIKAVEAYIGFMKDWGKAASELKSINRQLTTERSKLYNVCDQLLSDVVPQKDIEPMLQDPFGSLWQAEETKRRIRRRLWNSYDPFSKTVLDIQEALQTVQDKLSVDVTSDGQVKWVEKRWMPREFRRFLYRLDRKDYQDALSTISKGVNDLESLTRLSVALEPSRRKRSGGRVIGILRDLSSSVYRALRSSISCQCSRPHDVSLGLMTRFADPGHDDEDEKVLSETIFRVAISFETNDQGPTARKLWDEVKIERRAMPSIAPAPTPTPTPLPEAARPRRTKFVAFAKAQTSVFTVSTNSTVRSGRTPKDIKLAVVDVTRQLRSTHLSNTTLVNLPNAPSTEVQTLAISITPVDLCGTLKKAIATRPTCYGQVIDSQCPEHWFEIYPTTAPAPDGNAWSVITLKDVLWRKQGLQPLLWLEEKVRLALAVASAVLQLSKTPWLSKPLAKEDIHFFEKDGWSGFQLPFLRRQIPEPETARCGIAGQEVDQTRLQPDQTMFRLGILLLEIILGSTIERLREPQERIELQGDKFGMIRDSITAHRLLQTQVALINPAYKAVVERCVGCGSSQGLDEDGFRERVYNGVVAELEGILECAKLG
ncbi:hypothetical protein QBC34DRAFT_419358 [Podospora aff. communis PSN243]|uniref:DUF7580 domain-containing protein n=1 Tax=Podospora aff. communis PSN243 TaxID=3040156 RepID=A0AAV9G027_9PEZI|nr:hypothetical protein QBC34DRAFT_419358 [Podospora aff. communis PSN243]